MPEIDTGFLETLTDRERDLAVMVAILKAANISLELSCDLLMHWGYTQEDVDSLRTKLSESLVELQKGLED